MSGWMKRSMGCARRWHPIGVAASTPRCWRTERLRWETRWLGSQIANEAPVRRTRRDRERDRLAFLVLTSI